MRWIESTGGNVEHIRQKPLDWLDDENEGFRSVIAVLIELNSTGGKTRARYRRDQQVKEPQETIHSF